MNRHPLYLLLVALLTAAGGAATPRATAGRPAHGKAPASSPVTWQRYLRAPRGSTARLPADWKVGVAPKGFEPLYAVQMCGTYQPPTTVDEMTRAAQVIVVGTLAGHDGSFQAAPARGHQYTTYYLKVTGYLKDTTGRRAPFLKLLAPGGFLDGGQQASAPVPYLEPGTRYLFYLIPNLGAVWGIEGKTDYVLGTEDAYWALGFGIGRWWEEEGRLVGAVSAHEHYELPDGVPAPSHLSFGEGLRRVAAAVERERRGIPYLPPKREEPKFFIPE